MVFGSSIPGWLCPLKKALEGYKRLKVNIHLPRVQRNATAWLGKGGGELILMMGVHVQ